MAKKEKILLSWNGGMSVAVTLFEVKSPDYKVSSLVSAVEGPELRVVSSGVRQALIQRQAESLEMPHLFVPFPLETSGEQRDKLWGESLQPLKKKGLEGVAFDTVLGEDVKASQQKMVESLGLRAAFPIWGWDSKEVLRVFFSLGYRAIVTSVNLQKLPLPFVGRDFDRDFVHHLPSGVDVCGAQGEFTTFVYDGPFFQRTIGFKKTQIFERGGYGIQDLE